MRGYSLKPGDVLSLKVSQFWLLLRNLDRLQAQDDLRAFQLLICAQHGDSARVLFDRLQSDIGQIVSTKAPMHERGKLAAMMMRIGQEDARRAQTAISQE